MKIPVLAISIWMFIGMTVLGVFGYIYVLWNQYWKLTLEKHQMLIRNFKRSSYSHETIGKDSPVRHFPHMPHAAKHFENSSATLVTNRYNLSKVPTDKLMSKVNTYKNQLIVQLRKSQIDAANVIFDKKKKNRYNVSFKGQKPISYRTAKALVCEVKKSIKIEMLDQNTEPFKSLGFGWLFPTQSINKILGKFHTCAIVSSAGSMYKSKLGKEIDAHDAVLRFNSAPTEGFEDDVGTKTTIRILNSQVVSKPEFDFFQSSLYKNITMIAWDPSKYHGNLTNKYLAKNLSKSLGYKENTLIPRLMQTWSYAVLDFFRFAILLYTILLLYALDAFHANSTCTITILRSTKVKIVCFIIFLNP